MQISLQSKFQPNRPSGSRVMAILFKFWPKFGPSLGTLGPISKKFVRGLPPTMVGFVPKFQPSVTKTVGGVWFPRNKMATILYMYRFRVTLDYLMQKENMHLHNCSQAGPKRPWKCSHGTNSFIQLKVPFLSIDFANHLSCTSKKVKNDPKTFGRSTGFGPKKPGPKFLGSFWWHLNPVWPDLKSKKISVPYNHRWVPWNCLIWHCRW